MKIKHKADSKSPCSVMKSAIAEAKALYAGVKHGSASREFQRSLNRGEIPPNFEDAR